MKVPDEDVQEQAREFASNVRPTWSESLNPIEKALQYAADSEQFKRGLLRFVDVLPALSSPARITQAFREYFDDEAVQGWGQTVRNAIQYSPSSVSGRLLRQGVKRTARRFLAGFDRPSLLNELQSIADRGDRFSVDRVGEAVLSEGASDRYVDEYDALLDDLSGFDADTASISLKPTALCARFHPRAPQTTIERMYPRACRIIEQAVEQHLIVYFDMETDRTRGITFELVKRLLQDFSDYERFGVVIQAYHRSCTRDTNELIDWLEQHNRRLFVRLVKGAYWDEERARALRNNWPVPVYERKGKTDQMFERLAGQLVQAHPHVRPAFASHNLRSLAYGVTCAKQADLPDRDWEIQMLYGMGNRIQRAVRESGFHPRLYVPYGELLPGMGYLVRRLLENTANQSFLQDDIDRQTYDKPDPESGHVERPEPNGYQTVGPADFSRTKTRSRQQQAYDDRRDRRVECPVLVGDERRTGETDTSINPSRGSEVVGTVHQATEIDVRDALRKSPERWGEVDERAGMLRGIGNALEADRKELTALISYENGKNWPEADADVMEAIDFCYYYADQIERIGGERNRDVPGETNRHVYCPRGPTAVIAPWNFPLAILTGMTSAALAAGNPALVKPSGETSVIAYEFIKRARRFVPDDALHYLPGPGSTVGSALVEAPEINVVAFTGSRAVGQSIRRTVRDKNETMMTETVLEMGGKNAIIVGPSADIDEAVEGIVESAFGYQGQKCSACSRVIVHESRADELAERLRGATQALIMGPADDPDADMGPVIARSEQQRLRDAKQYAREEGEVILDQTTPGELPDGHYVGPMIVDKLAPDSQTMQTELFGPILGLTRVESIEEALSVANNVQYALTGGLYSRMPSVIEQAKEQMEVGNLYVNRDITGAVVGRQPFGGFKQSGRGTKAGGPDYLKNFLYPKTLTENITRKGYPGEA